MGITHFDTDCSRNLIDANAGLAEVMVEFVRSSVLDIKPCIPASMHIDWEKLVQVASEHGVLPWVGNAIVQLPVSQQPSRFTRISLGLSIEKVVCNYEHQYEVLHEIVDVCRQHDIRVMLLKGIGLSLMYPNPKFRPSGDIDLYFFDDFDRANEIFIREKSVQTELHVEFDYKNVHIENHKTFVYPNTPAKKRISAYLMSRCDSVVYSDLGCYVFCPIDNLVYLMMHTMNHVEFDSDHPFLTLRNLVDVSVFLYKNRSQLNPNQVFKLMDSLNFASTFELIVYLSEWLLGISFPEYHRGIIKRKDLPILYELLIKKGLIWQVDLNQPVYKQFCDRLNRYYRFNKMYKYMPHIPQGFFTTTLRQQFSEYIRYKFGISKSVPVMKGLRMKYCKSKI